MWRSRLRTTAAVDDGNLARVRQSDGVCVEHQGPSSSGRALYSRRFQGDPEGAGHAPHRLAAVLPPLGPLAQQRDAARGAGRDVDDDRERDACSSRRGGRRRDGRRDGRGKVRHLLRTNERRERRDGRRRVRRLPRLPPALHQTVDAGWEEHVPLVPQEMERRWSTSTCPTIRYSICSSMARRLLKSARYCPRTSASQTNSARVSSQWRAATGAHISCTNSSKSTTTPRSISITRTAMATRRSCGRAFTSHADCVEELVTPSGSDSLASIDHQITRMRAYRADARECEGPPWQLWQKAHLIDMGAKVERARQRERRDLRWTMARSRRPPRHRRANLATCASPRLQAQGGGGCAGAGIASEALKARAGAGSRGVGAAWTRRHASYNAVVLDIPLESMLAEASRRRPA